MGRIKKSDDLIPTVERAINSIMRVSFAIVLTLVSLPVAAQQQIGTAHKVTPAAHGSVAGTLSAGAGVHADETLAPTRQASPVYAFTINPIWTLGRAPASSSTFIYDPNRSSGKAVFDAAKGSFRFTTGAQGGGGTHQIKTPYGTLGIRG